MGLIPKPNDDMTDTKAAQIMTWFLGSVDPQYILNLQPYKMEKGMWDCLKQIYQQDNSARKFHLLKGLCPFRSIILILLVYGSIILRLFTPVYRMLPYSQKDQILMKLRSEFEQVCSNLLSNVPSSSIDTCLSELLCEEQRLATQVLFSKLLPKVQ